jgi:hypothetical protein
MISTVIALPYELARLPFAVLDTSLAAVAEESAPRLTLNRAIGMSDRFAGAVLRNGKIAERGAGRIERSQKLQLATRLEQEAATRREQAHDTAVAGARRATAQRNAAQVRAVSGLKEADAAEARGKAQARTDASKRASAKKAAATKRAAARTATVEKSEARADAAAQAKKQTAQRAAKAKLDDARTTKQAAEKTRADADRLNRLADTKKQQRKQS